MENRDFDRMLNPIDVQPGLDELPDFVADDTYLALKAACANACLVLNLQRTHRYSIAELKDLIDRFDVLAKQADGVMRLYAANDEFVFRYMDLCERYAELEAYLVRAQDFIARRASSDFWTIQEVVQFRDAHSAMYDQVFYVAEFVDFKWNYDWTHDAAMFLELDTANARSAMWDWNVSCEADWIRRFSELYDRINDELGLTYFYCCKDTDADNYFVVNRFKIMKTELKEMLIFQAKIGELRYEHWNRRIT